MKKIGITLSVILVIAVLALGVRSGVIDWDNDGIIDGSDNCPPTQACIDSQGTDPTCQDTYNPGQEDSNGNGIGDACEAVQDDDDDGIPNDQDACAGTVLPDGTGYLGLKPNHVGIDWVSIDGCNCAQLLGCKPGQDEGEKKFGCAPGTQEVWQNKEGWAASCSGSSKPANYDTDKDGVIDSSDSDDDNDGILDSSDSLPDDTNSDGMPNWWEN